MVKRAMAERVRAALGDTPVVLLHGARQTGKSTLAKAMASGARRARYLTFDDSATLAAARRDPQGFLAGLEGNLVIDEVQRVPRLFRAIKAEVDRDRRPGRFLLTGSVHILMVPRLSESLVGRMEILTLWPFSQGEMEGSKEEFLDAVFAPGSFGITKADSPRDITGRMLTGGFPEAMARKDPGRRGDWYSAYLDAILQRDVRDVAGITRLDDMPRLLSILASRAGGLLGLLDVSRNLGIPYTSLRRYLVILEMAFLVKLLPPWSRRVSARLAKAPKVLLCDTGLAAHLEGMDAERLGSDPMAFGRMLESFVAIELVKQAEWCSAGPRLMHFRAYTGEEVDVVLEDRAGNVVGVEVKASASVDARDFRGMKALSSLAGKAFRRGIVLYRGGEVVPFGKDMYAVPIGALWG
jgi:hypothetical protein